MDDEQITVPYLLDIFWIRISSGFSPRYTYPRMKFQWVAVCSKQTNISFTAFIRLDRVYWIRLQCICSFLGNTYFMICWQKTSSSKISHRMPANPAFLILSIVPDICNFCAFLLNCLRSSSVYFRMNAVAVYLRQQVCRKRHGRADTMWTDGFSVGSSILE